MLASYCGYRLLKHENYQKERINNLEQQVNDLNRALTVMQDEISILKNSDVEWSNTVFNYLAIGNSITKHPTCDYWWNEIGIAASTENKDYVHLINSYLQETEETCFSAVNFRQWEIASRDRSEFLNLLDGYLDIRLNLVIVQLSENVNDLSTFKEDFKELLNYISNKCPKAQVIVVGDFWDVETKDSIKKEVCNELNIPFVSLDSIKGKSEYQAGLNTVVYDAQGNEHVIKHEGVAVHPGDKGMEFIANAIEKVIKSQIED